MLEKLIIDNYKTNRYNGIIETNNCFYIRLRITGTGITIRPVGIYCIFEERLKNEYCKTAAMQHFANLPIIKGHSNNSFISSDNLYNNVIVGQTITSYIVNDDIWGVARFYDKKLLNLLGSGDYTSTSPAVSVINIDYLTTVQHLPSNLNIDYSKCLFLLDKNTKMPLKIIEKPYEMNHLALVKEGHWDQVKGSHGFDNNFTITKL